MDVAETNWYVEMLWFLSANELCGKSIRIQAFQTVCGLDKMTTVDEINFTPAELPMGDFSYRLNFDQGKKNEIQHHS
jgi:hypothetical protein